MTTPNLSIAQLLEKNLVRAGCNKLKISINYTIPQVYLLYSNPAHKWKYIIKIIEVSHV